MPPFRMIVALSFVLVSLLAAGCAKRPATATTTAPAPTGQAVTQPGAPPAGAPSGATPATPGSPATAGAPTPRAGEPPAPRPSPREFVAVPEVKDIHFDFDKYDVRPNDVRILDDNARWMKANPGYLVLIEGHADERGTNAYNLALGERHAKAAVNYLVAQGVQAGRLTLISYGEERPVCQDRTEACWARNRLAHFLVKPQ